MNRHHHHDADDELAKIPLFAGLGHKELEAVRRLLTEVTVAEGTVLTHEGGLGVEFFVIIDGTASIERGGKHLGDVGPGEFQGEVSLLDGGPRTATVTATSPMTILVATSAEFASLLDAVPSIARQMLPALAKRVRMAGNA